MATVAGITPLVLPVAGADMDAEPITNQFTNVLSFLNEAANFDEANADLVSADGLAGVSTAQTFTGLKTMENTAAAAGGVRTAGKFGLNPTSGTPAANDGVRLEFYADDAGGGVSAIGYLDVVMTTATATAEVGRIDFYVAASGGAVSQIQITDGILQPTTDSDVSLGVTGNRWSNLFTDAATVGGTLSSGAITSSGVITGTTIEATGDTSSGDNAAIGYTSAEGLILTGQGSTSDVTLKNDADTTVFTVPTGTDDILFPDSAKGMWGASSDLTVYHDGTNSYITNSEGALKIATETSGIAVTIGHSTSEVTVADNLTVTGTLTGTLATAAQGSVTSLGTLTALTVDDVAVDGKVITMTGSTNDTAVFTAGTHGTLTIETTDAGGAAANIQITADGTAELAGTTVTLDSGGDIELAAAPSGDVNIPAEIGLTFGDDGEKIEGDGTNLTATSSGLLTLTATGNTVVTNNAVVSGTLASGALTVTGAILPNADNGGALGASGTEWSDLFLHTGGVIDWEEGDVTLTHSANTLTVAGGTLATAALTATTITGSGVLSIDNTTDSTSGTDGSIHTDGGLGVAKKAVIIGSIGQNINPEAKHANHTLFQQQLGARWSSGVAAGSTSAWWYNAYVNTSGLYEYIASDEACGIEQVNGQIRFSVSNAAGTDGNTFTPVQAMTLTNAGVLNIAGLTASQDVQTDGSKNLTSVSDMTWKNDMGVVDGGVNIVKQLMPRYFDWKNDASGIIPTSDLVNGVIVKRPPQPRLAGFFSQEVFKVFPEGSPGGANTDAEGVDHWGLNGRALTAVTVAALQELITRVETLEAA